jgi:polysaccharide pyruvyl transferase WcaK-like protein
MKINIVGWFDKKNIGDECFKPAINHIFLKHHLEYITPPNNHTNPDIAVLGGGAVASPFYLEKLPKNCKKYALGIDLAYESESDLLAAAKFDGIFIRNQTDVKKFGWKFDCPVRAMPDLSFFLKPSGVNVIEKKGLRNNKEKKKVAVFPTDYVNPAIDRSVKEFGNKAYSFAENTAKELDILQENGWDVYIMCCSTGGYGDDRRMALQISSFCKNKLEVVLDTYSPQDMIDFIAQMDLTICQRFHSHLFSVIAGTPLISMEYTRKVHVFLEEMGIRDSITAAKFNGEIFDTSRMQDAVGYAYGNQEKFNKSFRQCAANHRNSLTNVKKIIQQEWLGECS